MMRLDQQQAGAALEQLKTNLPGMAASVYRASKRSMRPWLTDFAAPLRFTKPGDDWAVRMRTNITYYRGNYVALFGLTVIISILTNPLLLFALVVLSSAWAWLMSQKQIMPITLGGRTFNPFEQKAALAAITLLSVIITGLSSTIFWALGVSMVAVSAHAVTHTTEFHEVDQEEFTSMPGEGPGQV